MLRLPSIVHRHADSLSRVTAFVAVALVLFLGLLSASPSAHGYLHSDADHQEHSCPVTLFAHGVTTVVVGLSLALLVWRLLSRVGALCLVYIQEPAFTHLPGRAPPVF